MAEFSNLNYVNVGPHGTFRKSGELETRPADIDGLFQYLSNSGTQKLVLFFHGGLVKEEKGLAIAQKMHRILKDHAHPVTFVWETGVMETLTSHLDKISQTKLFQKILKIILSQVMKRLGGIGAKGPGETMSPAEIEAMLRKPGALAELDKQAKGASLLLDPTDLPDIQDEIQVEVELELEADPEMDEIVRPEVLQEQQLDKNVMAQISPKADKGFISGAVLAKNLAMVFIQVAKRWLGQRDHGLYPTVIEEILRTLYLADFGAYVWGGMKDQAFSMWAPNPLPPGDDSHVGTYFLDRLAALLQTRPGLAVDLIGHSAGSIAICHLLETAARLNPPPLFRNVVFLAPACTAQLFCEQIVSHPERFNNFRMFTMNDALETQDHLVPGLYTRSLLYLVSGILEQEADEPLAGLELHSRGVNPYDSEDLIKMHQFLRGAGKNRLVLSETTDAGAGLNSASHKHGDFDDDLLTQESLRAIVAA
jgi:pimeloyl-ACP methyl ester carboxylesterase